MVEGQRVSSFFIFTKKIGQKSIISCTYSLLFRIKKKKNNNKHTISKLAPPKFYEFYFFF